MCFTLLLLFTFPPFSIFNFDRFEWFKTRNVSVQRHFSPIDGPFNKANIIIATAHNERPQKTILQFVDATRLPNKHLLPYLERDSAALRFIAQLRGAMAAVIGRDSFSLELLDSERTQLDKRYMA